MRESAEGKEKKRKKKKKKKKKSTTPAVPRRSPIKYEVPFVSKPSLKATGGDI